MTRQKEVVFKSTSTFLKARHVKIISNDSMLENAEGHDPCHGTRGPRQCVSLPQVLNDIV